jgi:hypothetical protein
MPIKDSELDVVVEVLLMMFLVVVVVVEGLESATRTRDLMGGRVKLADTFLVMWVFVW